MSQYFRNSFKLLSKSVDFITFCDITFKVSFKLNGLLNKVSSKKREMHENLKLGANPPRSTHADGLTSKFYTAEVDICDGLHNARCRTR